MALTPGLVEKAEETPCSTFRLVGPDCAGEASTCAGRCCMGRPSSPSWGDAPARAVGQGGVEGRRLGWVLGRREDWSEVLIDGHDLETWKGG